jgi:hypothetical protein
VLQAMVNRQKQIAAMKVPPALHAAMPAPPSPEVSAPGHVQTLPNYDEYGPEVA